MNKAGLLGYAGNWNNEGIIAMQVETASCIENIVEIAAVPGVDILFLGQNDLCMSMGLYNKYEFPHMYTSPELNAATQKLIEQARKNNVILEFFYSERRASASSSTRDSPSSALATTCTTF